MHLELGMRLPLVALDDHQIDRRQPDQQLLERRLRSAAQLVHQRKPFGRCDQHLGRTRHAVGVGILAGLVDVEPIMGVLDGRDRVPARHQAGNHFGEQGGLAGALPAGQSDDAHGVL